jgi:hypothetical protein
VTSIHHTVQASIPKIFSEDFVVSGTETSWLFLRYMLASFPYSYHNSGHCPASCLLFKMLRFGDWILSPSSGGIYSDEPNRKRYSVSWHQ